MAPFFLTVSRLTSKREFQRTFLVVFGGNEAVKIDSGISLTKKHPDFSAVGFVVIWNPTSYNHTK